MAHRFSDGCQKTATVVGGGNYTSAGGGVQSYAAGTGRFGTTGLLVSGSAVNVGFADNPSTIFTAFAWQCGQVVQRILWSVQDSATRQVFLRMEVTGVINLVRGSTILATTAMTFPANVINHFEIKALINGTTGNVEVRLNGNTTPIINFTGNTQATANATLNQVSLENSGSGQVWFSDIHIWDTSGAAPTGFIGNKRIYTQPPTADGGPNQFSTQPSQSAGNHYLNVDEMPPNEDTDYNFDTVTNHRESYSFANLPVGVQGITEVVNYTRVRIDDAGPHTYKTGSRNNGVDDLSADINPGATYSYGKYAVSIDPGSGTSWNAAKVDNATLEVVITS